MNILELISEEIDQLHSGPNQTFHPQGPDYFYLTGSDFQSERSMRVVKNPKPYLLKPADVPNVTIEAVFGIEGRANFQLRGNFLRRARAHGGNLNHSSLENRQLYDLCVDGVVDLVSKHPGTKILYMGDSHSEFNEDVRAKLTETSLHPIRKMRYRELAKRVNYGDRELVKKYLIKMPEKSKSYDAPLRQRCVMDVAERFFSQPEMRDNNTAISKTRLAKDLAEYARDHFKEMPRSFQEEHKSYQLDANMIATVLNNDLFYQYGEVGDLTNYRKVVIVDDNVNTMATVNAVSNRLISKYKAEKIVWCVGVAPLK